MAKKKVFIVALVVCLVAIISLGTLAWFQSSDSVENIFKVSTDGAQKPDFKLDLFEHELLANGTLGTTEVKTNTYENIAPGDVLSKDPTVRNAGSYDMWVRMSVTLDNYAAWEAILGNGFDFSTLLKGVSADWTLDASTVGTGTLVYYKNTALAVGQTSTLFNGFEIPDEEFTVDNVPTEFKLTVAGDAIQSRNTGTNAKDAFANYWN